MNLVTEEIDLAELARGNSSSVEFKASSQVKDQRPDPPVRGERLLRTVDRQFHRLDQLVERFIPASMNPFIRSGAIANTTFLIALISGFLLLIWYKPSVYQAYESLDVIDPVGSFVRALHRYSSDACMLFIFFHAFKMFFARRFGGARWLAWVTGLAAVGLLWFDGWLGYWLVWDERANQVAVGTARMLDQLPIFAEPLSRSFLTDDSFNSLLFFLVFFFHMLIPLAIGIALWMHVTRLNKANFITGKKMTIAVLGSLGILSVLVPADLTEPARMLEVQESMPIDYFYMLPVYFTDRLEGGFLWLLTLLGTILLTAIPWLLVRHNPTAPIVNPVRCNGCEQCYNDCPFNAITMMRRAADDPKRGEYVADIDPDKCIACGICVGSCDPVGIEFPRLPATEIRREIDDWLERYLSRHEQVLVAYICSNSAGADLHIDEETGRCKELPGYIVRSIPCVGWVHPLMIERALRKGAEGVLVVGCQSEPDYRLGAMWTEKRIKGERHPALRTDKVNSQRVHYVQYHRTAFDRFIREARSFQRSTSRNGHRENGSGTHPAKTYTFGAALILVLGSLTYFFSKAPYRVPLQSESELVVSFTLPGRVLDSSAADTSSRPDLLPHMRGPNVPANRRRSDVRLLLTVDGHTVLEETYQPNGWFNDGVSSAVELIPLRPGKHAIQIKLGDLAGDEWLYSDQQNVEFEKHHRKVVKFSRDDGFKWYPGD